MILGFSVLHTSLQLNPLAWLEILVVLEKMLDLLHLAGMLVEHVGRATGACWTGSDRWAFGSRPRREIAIPSVGKRSPCSRSCAVVNRWCSAAQRVKELPGERPWPLALARSDSATAHAEQPGRG